MYSWPVTATFPVFLSLPIQLGTAAFLSRRCTSTYNEMMDLSDILDLQDVKTTTSDEDIPNLEDIPGFWIWTMVWINIYTPWTLSKWPNAELYKTRWTCLQMLIMHVPCDYRNLWTINAWILQECYEHVLLKHYIKEIPNIYQWKVTLRSLGHWNSDFSQTP